MPIEILMPALSPTMTEGNLARWIKQVGDKIAPGDVIAEIETDKATMEVEAVEEGTLGKIVVDEGTEGVPVNQLIALLLEEGEDNSAVEGYAGEGKRESPGTPPQEQAEGNIQIAEEVDQKAPHSQPDQAQAGYGREPGAGAGTAGHAAPGAAQGHKGRVFASPLARRLAEQNDLDLTQLRGSGPHGRIVKRDIEQALHEGTGKAKPATAEAPAPTAAGKAPEQAPVQPPAPPAQPVEIKTDRPYTEIKLNNMRKTIARRLTEAKQTIPHFYLSVDVELDALLDLRKTLNARGEKAGYKLSVNDFVIKASALALKQVPGCNASFAGDKIIQYDVVDIAVAVAIDGGLITPIVKDADGKTLSMISNEMKDLAKRAKDGKLQPQEYQGGGFSISNLGMFGISTFSAVINPPQGAILAVGAGEQRAVIKDGAVAAATVMTCTLSVDHRAVDGALGAQFLSAFKGLIQDPMAMLV